MSKASQKEFRSTLSDNLRSLGRQLLDAHIIRDASPLNEAATRCNKSNDSYWSYTVDNLMFYDLDPDNKIKSKYVWPKDVDDNFELLLSAKIKGMYPSNNNIEDLIIELSVNMVVYGILKDGTMCCSSWHLDRHLEEEHLEDGSYFVHPLYHFQNGGNKLNDFATTETFDSGNFIILDTPRIAHPPLDLGLAVDFVLGNYYGRFCEDIRSNSRYKDVISESINYFWKPYYLSTASYISGEKGNFNSAINYLPSLSLR